MKTLDSECALKGHMASSFDRPISLALSGGGIRAMAYHLGVLKWLAERGLFEQVKRISTVSGGSLLMGLIYKSADFKWPSSNYFLDKTWSSVTDQLCSRNLQLGAFGQLASIANWRFLFSRANLLALELTESWGLDVPLADLPYGPEWSINGTTAENGKRFRFKGAEIGDWDLGYADAPDFPLGYALAVSAAFPVGFGPLVIDTHDFVWRRRLRWGDVAGTEVEVKLPYRRLHLYDGGLYDNLGTEAFFDMGKQVSKHPGDYIIASDAGAPLAYGMTWGPLSPFRIKRMMDIMSDQTRSLRVRAFANFLQNHEEDGALLQIGTAIHGESCAEAQFAKTFPTSLERFDQRDFDRITSYGYEVTETVDRQYGVCRGSAPSLHCDI
ncbi:MAG: patatin-like phospholipase family protein [Pseudomonadota bacterium]